MPPGIRQAIPMTATGVTPVLPTNLHLSAYPQVLITAARCYQRFEKFRRAVLVLPLCSAATSYPLTPVRSSLVNFGANQSVAVLLHARGKIVRSYKNLTSGSDVAKCVRSREL